MKPYIMQCHTLKLNLPIARIRIKYFRKKIHPQWRTECGPNQKLGDLWFKVYGFHAFSVSCQCKQSIIGLCVHQPTGFAFRARYTQTFYTMLQIISYSSCTRNTSFVGHGICLQHPVKGWGVEHQFLSIKICIIMLHIETMH